ncbi:TVP38/TMEM64 family inner membrane protein YdjZ [Bremerella volcania]|uniref:TVP38/TMEM64 family membrane protein n=1 Tax=Bremerella volcania TaxID=2527984 RepID=A0A518C873_9BACT|nr:VTT domain-containing protein [Bremerella volcania]QDU75425.1 TVP38/TMEM64 family inner membrane protein YdjZ [Bremerella volcania]
MDTVSNQLDAEAREQLPSPRQIDSNPWLKTWALRAAWIAGVALLAFIAIWQCSDCFSLDYLASQEGELRAFQSNHPYLLYGIVFVLYTIGFAIGLPLAALMTIVVGWFFDFIPALILSSVGSSLGASLTFMTSRYFFRERMEQWLGSTMEKFQTQLEDSAAFYLFISRLIPQIPFVLVNLVMGLSPISLRTFFWVSQLSMLPVLIIFVWIGGALPSLHTIADEGISSVLSWQLMLGIAAMGIVPLLIRLGLNYYKTRDESDSEHSGQRAWCD